LAGGAVWLRRWWQDVHLQRKYLGTKARRKLHGKHGCGEHRHGEHRHDGHRCGGSLADQGLCEAGKVKRQRHEVVRRCDASRGCAARMRVASRGSAEQG
jgi:hypothetical protein